MKALIALEDGTLFEGQSFTGPGEAIGEIVFNTSMTGYQEVLTDPSYTGQIVTMTYPLIGNYGISIDDMESAAVHPMAFLVKEYNRIPSNFRSTMTLADFLKKYGVLGVEGFDTRALVRHIRTRGAMKGIVSTLDLDRDSLVERARSWTGLLGVDMVERVTCPEPFGWTDLGPVPGTNITTAQRNIADPLKNVAFDFGMLCRDGSQIQLGANAATATHEGRPAIIGPDHHCRTSGHGQNLASHQYRLQYCQNL